MYRFGVLTLFVWPFVATACGGDAPSAPSAFPSIVPGSMRASRSAAETGTAPQVGVPGHAVADASSCAVVRTGTELMVSGSTRSDGTIRATHVIAGPPPGTDAPTLTPMLALSEPPPGAVPGTAVSVAASGIVASLGGDCPNLTFTVGSTRVTTDPATQFYGQ